MKKLIYLIFAISVIATSSLCAQDFVGTATFTKLDAEESILSGQLTFGMESDEIVTLEFENVFGESYTHDVLLFSDGEFLGIVSNDNTPRADLVSVALVETSSGNSLGAGLVLVDTDDLGEDWDPLDIEDEDNWTGCEDVADDIKTTLGGDAEIIIIKPKPPATYLGGYREVQPSWIKHWVVVKDGKVYDGFGPRTGLSIDDYKELWEGDDSDIDFGF